jgi:hypothetical protein
MITRTKIVATLFTWNTLLRKKDEYLLQILY